MPSWKRNLYILILLQFLVVGAMSMIVPFLPFYLRELGVTDQSDLQLWSGLVYGVNFLSAFLVAPIWGSLADRFGRKIMVLRSGFGMMIVTGLMGLVTSAFQLFILRFLSGLVSGFIPASVALVATNTPEKKVGYALGMLQSGVVAGLIMGPSLGGVLAEMLGFRSVFFVTAVIICVAATIALWMVKEDFTPKNQEKRSFWQESAAIFHRPKLIFLFVIAMLVQFSIMGPVAQMSLFVSEIGAPGGYVIFFSGLIFAVMGVSNMISAPLIGKLGDRLGTEKVFLLALLVTATFFIPHFFVFSIWFLLVVRFLLGVGMGGLIPSISTLIRKYAPAGKESIAFGYHTSAVCVGNMAGPVVYGILSSHVGIRGLFLLTSALLFVTAFLWKGFVKTNNFKIFKRGSS